MKLLDITWYRGNVWTKIVVFLFFQYDEIFQKTSINTFWTVSSTKPWFTRAVTCYEMASLVLIARALLFAVVSERAVVARCKNASLGSMHDKLQKEIAVPKTWYNVGSYKHYIK